MLSFQFKVHSPQIQEPGNFCFNNSCSRVIIPTALREISLLICLIYPLLSHSKISFSHKAAIFRIKIALILSCLRRIPCYLICFQKTHIHYKTHPVLLNTTHSVALMKIKSSCLRRSKGRFPRSLSKCLMRPNCKMTST